MSSSQNLPTGATFLAMMIRFGGDMRDWWLTTSQEQRRALELGLMRGVSLRLHCDLYKRLTCSVAGIGIGYLDATCTARVHTCAG